jgi:hypothetical protein
MKNPLSVLFQAWLVPLLFVLAVSWAGAAPVSSIQAAQVASGVAKGKLGKAGTVKPANSGKFANPARFAKSGAESSEDAAYFVFDMGEGEGFVVVSGNDAAVPVLGYADSGSYDPENLPPAFEAYLSELEGQLKSIPMDAPPAVGWDGLLTASAAGYDPGSYLVKTTWNQEAPYWQETPLYTYSDGSTAHTYTGCLTTAWAQIAKYWEYPAQGTGVLPAYTTTSYGLSVPGIPLDVAYDYAGMANTYASSTPASEVALLMYHLGAAFQMNYGPQSSGSTTLKAALAMIEHFGYDGGMRLVHANDYSASAWQDLMKAQIDARQVVAYSGEMQGSGHSFLLDGYDTDGRFHLNWGWGGNSNGFYVLTVLQPTETSVGPYALRHDAVIGIKPDEGGKTAFEPRLTANLETGALSLKRGENITVTGRVGWTMFQPASGKIGLGVMDEAGELLGLLDLSSFSEATAEQSADLLFSSSIPTDLEPGTYRLGFFSQDNADESASWSLMRGNGKWRDEYTIQIVEEATLPITACADSLFAGGWGSSDSPFLIAEAAHLDAVRYCRQGGWYFQMTRDIDLSPYLANTASGWLPIGGGDGYFEGDFDGNGFHITGLWMDRSSQENVGLFGLLSSAAILRNVGVELDDSKGGVQGFRRVGGLLGVNMGSVLQSSVEGNVGGTNAVGGLVGHNSEGASVAQSYATGSVVGTQPVGGLVGYNAGSIDKSYAIASVALQETNATTLMAGLAGGLAGRNEGGAITESYAASTASETNHAGGLVGYQETGSVTESYYDMDRWPENTYDIGVGLSSAAMKLQSTFVGWDFTSTWTINAAINGGYPAFRWQKAKAGDVPVPVHTVAVPSQGRELFYDLRGKYLGRSLSAVERPGVYIVRQGSQVRKIVVR